MLGVYDSLHGLHFNEKDMPKTKICVVRCERRKKCWKCFVCYNTHVGNKKRKEKNPKTPKQIFVWRFIHGFETDEDDMQKKEILKEKN